MDVISWCVGHWLAFLSEFNIIVYEDTTLRIMTLSTKTLDKKTVILSIIDTQHNNALPLS
jgi:hypothetical protein